MKYSANGAKLVLLLLAGCAQQPPLHVGTPSSSAPIDISILAFNDFHGNLEPPHRAITATDRDGKNISVPAGGVAYLASAIKEMRTRYPGSILVSAGDLIGASPLPSSLFLDEPSIEAMNLIGLDFNAVGNHEFDAGEAELLRKQNGGCQQHGTVKPCQLSPFTGAQFRFLAGNTHYADGRTLFPAYGMKTIEAGNAAVRVGFIGLTLKGTAELVSKEGIRNLHYSDEADAANALIPRLREEGADIIVLLIHQGGQSRGGYNDKSCPALSGDIIPVLDRLDTGIDVVVSGHTHQAYICDYAQINAAKPFLLTSAGQYGTLLTHISLSFDPKTKKLLRKSADNMIVQSEEYDGGQGLIRLQPDFVSYPKDPAINNIVVRYTGAAKVAALRVVGHIEKPLVKNTSPDSDQSLGRFIADAQLAATASATGSNAQIALMNPGGVRADLVPDKEGAVTFGQIFNAQPFSNNLATQSYSGRQLRAILEQQFDRKTPMILHVSHSLRYEYDMTRPTGQKVREIWVNGAPVRDDAIYRITTSEFLMTGGDGFTTLLSGTDKVKGMLDIEALERYLATEDRPVFPAEGRIIDVAASPVAAR